MAIVAADTAGRRADRIEALLSARLFVEPQLADDRITFVSNLSGHLSLYAMDASGGVPEPLLPPQIALQNPELVGGHLYHVLSTLGQILVMIDSDGDENYVPYVIPIDGGFPEPLAPETFAGGRSHLVARRRRDRHRVLRRRVRRGVADDCGPRSSLHRRDRDALAERVRSVRRCVDA